MRRRRWFPIRLWTWMRARIDARSSVPPPNSDALGETEQEILRAYNNSLQDEEKRFGTKADPVEAKLNDIRKELREIHYPEYERLSTKAERRDVHTYMSLRTHWILLILFGLAEGAFNLVAFNVMGEPGPYTILMASAVALGIPICAYLLGILLRQWPEPIWKTAVELLVIMAIVVGALMYINEVRFAYIEELDAAFVKAHPGIGRAFLAINILVLLSAAAVTYLSHDPITQFAETKSKMDWCNSKISYLEGQLDQWTTEFETEVQMYKQSGWSLIALYRNVNRRHRNGVPKYFDDDNHKNYHPEFVKVREVKQFHLGAHDAGFSHSPVSNRSEA
jgi:hypothetical protein